jgi:hypothetical protein
MNENTVLLNRVIEEEAYRNLNILRYTRKRPLYAYGRRPCMVSRKLGAEPLMYNRSVVKNSFDKGSILKWFFRSPG